MVATKRLFWGLAIPVILFFMPAENEIFADSKDATAATEKLRILSETMKAENIQEIRELIQAGADVNLRNRYGWTLLFKATYDRQTDIVKLLLEAKVDVEGKCASVTHEMNAYTPLLWASKWGQTEIVKMLVDAKANVNVADAEGYTPLLYTIGHVTDSPRENIDIIKQLLAANANPDASLIRGGQTALLKAIGSKENVEYDIVTLLIAAKANINVADESGKTPLWAAMANNHFRTAALLIDSGANVNALGEGCTPLLLTINSSASSLLKNEMVKKLLAAKADVNIPNEVGTTPLLLAVAIEDFVLVKTLLDAKADVNASAKNGDTPLYQACTRGNIMILQQLLAANANVNTINKDTEYSPLMAAANAGYTEVVKILLEAKAEVNSSGIEGYSALHLASFKGHIEIVKMLLEAKAAINATNEEGITPLLLAAGLKGNKYPEVVGMLLEYKADVNMAYAGITPLWIASKDGDADIVKQLLAAKAEVNVTNQEGITPLMIASVGWNPETVKLLLEAQADVNATDNTYDYTSLLVATMKGNNKIVKLLLDAGANVNVICKPSNETPLFIASKNGRLDIVKLLIEAKADVNARSYKNGKSYTALGIAKENGNGEVVKFLKDHGATD
jgi:serine/threonine-protein phosphatase 6 regulatory ankyrin repeat subunit B